MSKSKKKEKDGKIKDPNDMFNSKQIDDSGLLESEENQEKGSFLVNMKESILKSFPALQQIADSKAKPTIMEKFGKEKPKRKLIIDQKKRDSDQEDSGFEENDSNATPADKENQRQNRKEGMKKNDVYIDFDIMKGIQNAHENSKSKSQLIPEEEIAQAQPDQSQNQMKKFTNFMFG